MPAPCLAAGQPEGQRERPWPWPCAGCGGALGPDPPSLLAPPDTLTLPCNTGGRVLLLNAAGRRLSGDLGTRREHSRLHGGPSASEGERPGQRDARPFAPHVCLASGHGGEDTAGVGAAFPLPYSGDLLGGVSGFHLLDPLRHLLDPLRPCPQESSFCVDALCHSKSAVIGTEKQRGVRAATRPGRAPGAPGFRGFRTRRGWEPGRICSWTVDGRLQSRSVNPSGGWGVCLRRVGRVCAACPLALAECSPVTRAAGQWPRFPHSLCPERPWPLPQRSHRHRLNTTQR